MRILIFSTNYLPNVGGAEIAIREITDRLPQHTFDMIVPRLSRALPKREQIGNITVYRIGIGFVLDKPLFPIFGFIKTLSLNKANTYDLFWAMMVSYASGVAYMFNIFRRRNPIPIVLTLQEGDSEEHINTKEFGWQETFWRPLIWVYAFSVEKSKREKRKMGMIEFSWHLALPRSTFVTVISEYLKNQALKYGYEGPIEVVPNGVDIEKFKNEKGKDESERIRKKLGIGENEKMIFTASRLVEKNGIGDLISAMKYLPDNAKLVIAGDGALKEALKARAYKFGDRVKFIGSIDHAELPSYLAAADVFVRPSLSEGMGNAFTEAMAAGVPVVGTEVGGIPDFLEHEKTGLFCNVKDPQSIGEQVMRLFDDSALRQRIVENALGTVEKRYSWDMVAEQIKEVFQKTT